MAKYTSKIMFTGIIKEIGKVKEVSKKTDGILFTIEAQKIIKKKKIGESISVNGVCVTITKIKKSNFKFQAVRETINRSNLKNLKKGDFVNLEPALSLNQSLDGHLVQGHVDCEGIIENFKKDRKQITLTIKFPKQIASYLTFKGSVAINGVSLTISDIQDSNFSVCLIPHTLKNTNLKNLKKGDKVNLEVDLIARYLKNLLKQHANQ